MLSVTEVAEKLGFSRQTILKWINDEKIKAIRIEREYRIPDSELKRIFYAHDLEDSIEDDEPLIGG